MKNMQIKTLQKHVNKANKKINKALEQFTKDTGIVIDEIGLQSDDEYIDVLKEKAVFDKVVYMADIRSEIDVFYKDDKGKLRTDIFYKDGEN